MRRNHDKVLRIALAKIEVFDRTQFCACLTPMEFILLSEHLGIQLQQHHYVNPKQWVEDGKSGLAYYYFRLKQSQAQSFFEKKRKDSKAEGYVNHKR